LFSSKFPNVDTKVIELNRLPDGFTIQSTLAQMTGQRTVPSVWVKGEFVGGNDDTQGLFRSGKLSEMLQ
jgi:glutaredoxin 3